MLHKTKTFTLKPLIAALAFAPGLVIADNQLSQIVVTANNTEQTQRSVTANMHVITREEIELGQYQTFAEALRNIPGVFIQNSGGIGQATSIFVRGASSANRQVLILVNGIEMTDTTGFGADIANLRLNNVERIEIIKGPQSGIWGANASAGVINIITRSNEKATDLFFEVGSHGSHQLTTFLGGGNDQVDFSLSLQQRESDGFSAIKPFKTNGLKFERDGFSQDSRAFTLGVNPKDNHRIEAFVSQSNSTNEFDGGFPANPNDKDSFNTYADTQRMLSYRFNNNTVGITLSAHENNIDRSFSSNFKTEGRITKVTGLIDYDYKQANKLSIAANRTQFEGKTNSNPQSSYTNNGLAVSNLYAINKNLFSDQSLRLDQYDEFNDAITGRLGIKNFFNDDLFIAANYATGYNPTSIFQATTLANPKKLKPESVVGYELTLGFYGAALTYFERKTEDLITGQGVFPNNFFINSEGTTKEKGLEFEYSNNLDVINTHLNFNLSWLDTKNQQNQTLAYRPDHIANLGLHYYGIDKLNVGFETRYVGKQYSAENRQGAQIGEYFVTDARAQYDINKHLSIQGKIINLFNEDYVLNVVDFPATNPTPNLVYGNGGTQFFVGIRAKL
jgi:vitamin B12 transporter